MSTVRATDAVTVAAVEEERSTWRTHAHEAATVDLLALGPPSVQRATPAR